MDKYINYTNGDWIKLNDVELVEFIIETRQFIEDNPDHGQAEEVLDDLEERAFSLGIYSLFEY